MAMRLLELALVMGQSKTTGAGPPTDTGDEWAREHPDLAKTYPGTYALFGPEGGKFDYSGYLRQIRTGERKVIKPSDAMEMANVRVAGMLYRTAKAKLRKRPSAAQRQWLAEVKTT